MQIVSFENVELAYGDNPPILRDINFTLTQGSFHFLTGSSGAGKTSLLRIIFLAKRPTRGQVLLFGEPIASLPRRALANIRRKIGVVFQEFRLLEHLSIYENTALPLRVTGQKEAHYRATVLDLLDWVGLSHCLDATPSILSGGEQQRAAIARAVVSQPQIIIADEPTGNVDTQMGQRLMRLFIELNKLGTTILIATHDQHLWQAFDYPRLHLEAGTLARKIAKQPAKENETENEKAN